MKCDDKITFSSIAREVGVTTCVVSRVLKNNSTTISIGAGTKKKILDSAWEKGLVLNSNIGLMIPDTVAQADFIYYPVMSGVMQQCMKADYGILNDIFDSTASSVKIPDFLTKRKVSGMLFVDSIPGNIKDMLLEEKIPYVIINPSSDVTEKDCVMFDDHEAMTELLEYLKSKGYKDYVYVSLSSTTAYSRNVISSFKEFTTKNKFENTIILSNPSEEEKVFDMLNKRISNAGRNTVFITPSRLFTIKILALCETNSKSAPADIGIVGSSLLAEYWIPKLTTVQYPFFEMGVHAVEMLKKKQTNRQYSMGSEFIGYKIIKNGSTRS